jgi:hypothetical protein
MKLASKSLGKVASNTLTQISTDTSYSVARLRFQWITGQTGVVYVGLSTMVPATGVGVLAILSSANPIFEVGGMEDANRVFPADYYIQAAVTAEGVVVSALVVQ